jgi:superfamily II RNA helicase
MSAQLCRKNLPENPTPDDILNAFLDYLTATDTEPYDHQEEAILELFAGNNVILNTPTGSGKSLVALALQFKSLCQGRRSYYTVPIKALANEKFLSLCHVLGPENVGMITGDATVNHDAPVICCTAEILANIALRDGANAPVDDVIMDEFHYYSDHSRGAAWQIPLLTLPRARFLLMSATLGDSSFFSKQLTALTGAPTTLVQSDQRPVPLEFEYSTTQLQEKVAELNEQSRSPVYSSFLNTEN